MKMNMKETVERAMGKPALEGLVQKYRTARLDLLILVGMTLVNVVLLLAGSTTYFLFSGAVPYYLVLFGMVFCGKLPDMETDPELLGMVIFPGEMLFLFVAAALLILGVYVALYFLSKKNYHFLTASLVLFVLDTAAMLWLGGLSIDSAIDLVFHIWMIYSLFVGVRSAKTLVNAPVEDTVIAPTQYRELEDDPSDSTEQTEEIDMTAEPSDASAPEEEKAVQQSKIDTSNFLEFDYFDKKE